MSQATSGRRAQGVAIRRAALRAGVCLVLMALTGGSVMAARIQLDDGTQFSGTVVRKDGQNVMIVVPRSSVGSVDGVPLPEAVTVGKAAPTFSVVDLRGTTQTLGSASGEATLMLFWASWCPHCRSDVGLMKDLCSRYQGKGLRLVTVSVDRDMNALNKFVQDQQLPYPIIAAGSQPNSPESQLPERYEVQGIPTYFLVDARGVITWTMSGSVTESKLDLEGLLKPLIVEATSSPSSSQATSGGRSKKQKKKRD